MSVSPPTIAGLTRAGVSTERVEAGDAIAVELLDHVDVGRGDVIVVADAAAPPSITVDLVADVCWLDDAVVEPGRRFVLKHLARQVPATVAAIVHRLDPSDLRAVPATTLAGNDLGRVRIVLDEPIVADRYDEHRQTGHFVLIDPATNLTVAAGMIEEFA